MTNKLFVTIYGNIGTNVQDTSSAMATIIKVYCNNAYREILRRVNWRAINYSYQISTVAGQQDYILPSDFGKELYLHDATNLRYIPFISAEQLVETFPSSLTVQGTVDQYTIYKDVVRTQPTSAATISFVSSNSGDTSQAIRIKGTDSNDIEVEETINLNGLTTVPTTNSYKTIRSITKSASTTGRITGTSGATTVAILAPADLDYKVKKLRLHDVPSTVLTLNFPYFVRPYPLNNDYDVPVFDCADGIELGGTMMAWRYKRQFAKAQEYERLFEKWIVDAAWDMENQPNQTHMINPKTSDRDNV